MLNNRTVSDFIAADHLASAVQKDALPFLLSAGSPLFREGNAPEAVYFVKAGEVTLTMHAAGKSIVSFRAGPGSLLGLPAILGNKPYSLTAVAEGDVEVYKIAGDEFREMVAQDGRMGSEVLRILACDVHSARASDGKLL